MLIGNGLRVRVGDRDIVRVRVRVRVSVRIRVKVCVKNVALGTAVDCAGAWPTGHLARGARLVLFRRASGLLSWSRLLFLMHYGTSGSISPSPSPSLSISISLGLGPRRSLSHTIALALTATLTLVVT